MILAAGLTPAWQQILEFDRLSVGGVNRARSAQWVASGKVINVAIALAHLGADSQALTLAGGQPREAIARELTQLGVRHRLIETHRATRVCTTLVEAGGQTTELVENAGPITGEELADFRAAFGALAAGAEIVVFSGSLPAGVSRSLYAELLEGVAARVVLDASGPELLAALARRPFLVKPNREELARTLQREFAGDADLFVAIDELHERGASWVVVSAGAGGLWVSGQRRRWHVSSLAVATVNPIGCGDCLTAGIAARLAAGEHPLSAVRYGVAAAAENARQLLPARLDPVEVARLADSVVFSEVRDA
jgi:1-phosphofructokinase family hexose kinase